MNNVITTKIRSLVRRFGIDIVRYNPPYFGDLNKGICDLVMPYTMTSPERVYALIDAVQYVVKNEVDGALVECGVWKGGSSMAMALTLNPHFPDDSVRFGMKFAPTL